MCGGGDTNQLLLCVSGISETSVVGCLTSVSRSLPRMKRRIENEAFRNHPEEESSARDHQTVITQSGNTKYLANVACELTNMTAQWCRSFSGLNFLLPTEGAGSQQHGHPINTELLGFIFIRREEAELRQPSLFPQQTRLPPARRHKCKNRV